MMNRNYVLKLFSILAAGGVGYLVGLFAVNAL